MKLNIMIVDDEPKVLRGIRAIIERSGENWSITGEFKNGVEALAAIINDKPDVIISDIKMPCMDGLELVERAKDIAPDLKFIILSGFPDFSYAQQAIRLETVDYILKPPDYRDIINNLKKVEFMLEEKQNKLNEENELKYLKEIALNQTKDNLFTEIIYNNNISPHQKGLKFECFHSSFALLVIKLDSFSFSVFHETADSLNVLTNFRKVLQTAVYKRNGCIADLHDGSFCCLINMNNTSPVYVQGVARELRNELCLNNTGSITLGISRCYNSPDKLNTAFKECLHILRNKVFYNKNSILLFEELNLKNSPEGYPVDIEHKYVEALQFSNFEKAQTLLTEIIDRITAISVDSTMFKGYIMEFAIVVMRNLFEDRSSDKTKLPSTNEIYNKLSILDNRNDITDLLISYTKTIADYFDERNRPGCRKVIKDIKGYVTANYFNNISLRQIAKEFYMNESYLSDLFKKETGTSFSSYLSNVRIEQSKILLNQVDLLTQDIAEMVGYNDSRYFMKVFKKIVGMTPSEYRERILNHD